MARRSRNTAPRPDIHAEVTAKVLEAMEAGVSPWRSPWAGGFSGGMPERACGTPYRGVNVFMLWLAAFDKGFRSNRWMTFNQAKELGGSVNKGSKSTRVINYGVREREDASGNLSEIPYMRSYAVFNADQISGLPEKFYAPLETKAGGAAPLDDLEVRFAATGARITHSRDPRAFYRVTEDLIHMPDVALFESTEGYYATKAHELIHWTGAGHRLDRLQDLRDKENYAREELVSELGACMLCAHLGLEPQVDQSAAYLDSWLAMLKEDSKAIFKAATAAQAAVDYVLDTMATEEIQEAA